MPRTPAFLPAMLPMRREELGRQCDVLDRSRSGAAVDRRGAGDGCAGGLLRPLGTRHSFSRVADTSGVLLSTEHLDQDRRGRRHGPSLWKQASATASSGARLLATGWPSRTMRRCLTSPSAERSPPRRTGQAPATSRSLPRSLRLNSSAQTARSCALPAGTRTSTEQSSALGALGLVVRVTLDVVAEFELRQQVFEGLPWAVRRGEPP